MNVDEAKFELEMAERNLRGCYAYRDQAIAAWRDAEAARGSNDRHYRLRRLHGDDYLQKLTAEKGSAFRQCEDAEAQRGRAKEAYEKAVAAARCSESEQ